MNQSAFPLATPGGSVHDVMTLRDYFAAHAPITVADAMIVCGRDSSSIGMLGKSRREEVLSVLAVLRTEYANAMLAERAK